ncbi:GNAT family N-acetyltransferase [Gymnodinialimonas sp.]
MTELKTTRLTLRLPTLDDWPAYRDFYMSEASASVGGPLPLKEAWTLFASDAGHWALHGYGWFVLHDATGPVGTCGIHFPPRHADVEIGWNTFASGQGKGYATEAAHAVLDWAPSVIGDQPIVSYIGRDNAASRRVAEKLGATDSGKAPAHNDDCTVWIHKGGRP